MEGHVYSRQEAELILNGFPPEKLLELLHRAQEIDERGQTSTEHPSLELPEGWHYRVFGNCIVVRYLDGEQERQKFFVPQIWINFQAYVGETNPRLQQSVQEVLPLGFCSCGKPIPFMQLLLKASDMIQTRGIRNVPTRALGYGLGVILAGWAVLKPTHQYSMLFNRHPTCL